VVRAIRTGELKPKQNGTGNWDDLYLGHVVISVPKLTDVDELVDLAIDALTPREGEADFLPEEKQLEPKVAAEEEATPTNNPPAEEAKEAPDLTEETEEERTDRPTFPEPSSDQFKIFVDATLRYCRDGYVSLRLFDQNDRGKPPFLIRAISLK